MNTFAFDENKIGPKTYGNIFFAGRYFIHTVKNMFNVEWYLFHKARSGASAAIHWGSGDCDRGLSFHIAIPYLFSFWVSIERFFRTFKESRETSIKFHDGTLYINIYVKPVFSLDLNSKGLKKVTKQESPLIGAFF